MKDLMRFALVNSLWDEIHLVGVVHCSRLDQLYIHTFL
jgi:hypothetical protein